MSDTLVLTNDMINDTNRLCIICMRTISKCSFCPARYEKKNDIIEVIGFCIDCRRDTKKKGNHITRNDILANKKFSHMRECMSKAYKRKMDKWPENNISKI